MADDILGPFSVHTAGGIGQEIRDPDGTIIAWTTDVWVAQVIARLLIENEHLLLVRCEPTTHHIDLKALLPPPHYPLTVRGNRQRPLGDAVVARVRS